jgi:hypothetical protein
VNRMFLLGVFVLFIFFLTACSLDINISTDDKEPTVTDNGNNPDKDDDKQYQNEAFKEVTVLKSNGLIKVKGKARVFEGVFQYAVVAGTEVLLEDFYQTDGAPAWGDFEITFDEELAAREGTVFELFVYSAKDGSKTDILTIPIK